MGKDAAVCTAPGTAVPATLGVLELSSAITQHPDPGVQGELGCRTASCNCGTFFSSLLADAEHTKSNGFIDNLPLLPTLEELWIFCLPFLGQKSSCMSE